MPTFHGRDAQHGIVALALLMLVAVTLSSLALVASQRPQHAAQTTTVSALAQARAALLGYAAAYPDRVNTRFGPGYLPCPAPDTRGISGPACAAASGSTRGRFPWHTLRTNDLRDAAGETLWYAVSDSHRYNPKREPLNSDTPALLRIDGEPAVAVLLAAGPPLRDQLARRTSPRAAREFLEAHNGDRDVSRFTAGAAAGAPFNDALLAITPLDLMYAVEARVIGEVARRLGDYAARHGGHYPWPLALGAEHALPVTAPVAGRIPFHYHDPARADAAASFTSEVALSWELHDAALRVAGPPAALRVHCLTSSACVGAETASADPALRAVARCRWGSPTDVLAARAVASCAFTARVTHEHATLEYRVSFAIGDDDGDIEVRGPDTTQLRTRRVATRDPGAMINTPGLFFDLELVALSGDASRTRAILSLTPATRGHIAVDGLRYAIDVDHGELPAWFVRNAWHEHIRIARAGAQCATTHGCVRLNVTGRNGVTTVHEDIRALVVSAGAALPLAPPRFPGAGLRAWFEDNNALAAVPAPAFLRAPRTARFNDRVRVIERAR